MRARIGRMALVVAIIGGMSLIGMGTAQAAVTAGVAAVRDCDGLVTVDFDVTGLPPGAQVRGNAFFGDADFPDELAGGASDDAGNWQGQVTLQTDAASLEYLISGPRGASTTYATGSVPVANGCSTVTVTASSELGCASDPVIAVRVAGLGDRQSVTVVLDAPGAEGGTPATSTSTSSNDGVAVLSLPFDGTDRATVGYVVTADGGQIGSGVVSIEDVCAGTGTLTVTRDCASPETLTFALDVAGLQPDTDHDVIFSSDGFTLNEGFSGSPIFLVDFTTDGSGAAAVRTTGSEDEGLSIASGALDVDFDVASTLGLSATRILGQATVAACSTTPPDTGGQPVVIPPVTGTPGAGAAPVAGSPSATPAPVAVAAGTTPRALATTGSPVGSLALLGGGLVLAGGLAAAGARAARR